MLVPVPVTWLLVTSIVSKIESLDDFLIVILPFSTSTASEKFRIILSSPKIYSVASSTGNELVKEGFISSTSSMEIVSVWMEELVESSDAFTETI